MEDFLINLGKYAAGAAALVTILSLGALIVKGVVWLWKAPEQIRAYFFRPKYILIPTAEEMARYSIKSFEAKRDTLDELSEEMRGWYERYFAQRDKDRKSRIAVIYAGCLAIYCVFLARLLYFGFSDGGPKKVAFANALTAMLTLLAAVLLVSPVLDARTRTAVGKWLRHSLRRSPSD